MFVHIVNNRPYGGNSHRIIIHKLFHEKEHRQLYIYKKIYSIKPKFANMSGLGYKRKKSYQE